MTVLVIDVGTSSLRAAVVDTDGRVVTDFGDQDQANGVAIQPDGKIVAAGTSSANIAVARYHR